MSKRGENIRKRKDGRWEARYVKSRTLEGKAEYGYIYGRTYEEVKTRKLLAQQQVRNCLIPIKSMSMKQLFTEWLGSIRHTVKESSFALYETMIEKHLLPWFGKCRLGHITTEMIQNFSVEKLRLGFSARTVRCILMTMRSAMSYGEKMGYLSMGDVQIRYPKIAAEQSFRVLSENQLEQLVEYLLGAENRIAAGILISVYSGIRVGELCGLQWRDLDFDNGIMKITKTVSRIKI